MARFGWERIDRERALAAGGLALLLAALFPEVLLFGAVLVERDLHLMYQPQAVAVRRALAGGEWPFWNRWAGFGQPLWANANAQLAYPPAWPGLLLSPARALTLLVVLHAAWAALGTARLARALELSRPAALLAAFGWIASGPFVSSVNLWNHLCGIAWIPWIALGAERAVAAPSSWRVAAWGGAAAAAVLAGSPEAAVIGAAASLPALRHGRRALPIAAAAAAIAVGLSAVQWIPAWMVVRGSVRAVMPPQASLSWSAHPLALAQLVWPVLQPDVALSEDLRARLLDGRPAYLLSLYLGLPVATLAACAFGARRRAALVLAAVAAVLTVAALGSHVPGATWIVAHVPGLRAFRYPVKALFGVSLAMSLLAGLGWDALRARRARRPGIVLLAASALALLALQGRLAPPDGPRVAAAIAVAALVVWTAHGPQPRALASLALVLAELVARHASLNVSAPPALLDQEPPSAALARPPAGQRLYVVPYDAPTSIARLGRSLPYVVESGSPRWLPAAAQRFALAPYAGGTWGLEGSYDWDLMDLSPLPVDRLGWALRAHEGDGAAFERVLRLGAVARVASLHELPLPPLHLVRVLVPEPLRIYDVPDPMSRVSVVSGVRALHGPDDVIDPTFDPRREVAIDGGTERAPDPGFEGEARVTAAGETFVEIETRASAPGHVVLRDAWDAGWSATVDGAAAPVLRADEAFRAVPVPAGVHRVRMTYRPPGLVAGALVTLVTLAALTVAVLRRPRLSAPGDTRTMDPVV